MKIHLNGETREIGDGATLEALLSDLGLVTDMVATEVNLVIVTRAERAKKKLKDGDQIEVVSFVGGG